MMRTSEAQKRASQRWLANPRYASSLICWPNAVLPSHYGNLKGCTLNRRKRHAYAPPGNCACNLWPIELHANVIYGAEIVQSETRSCIPVFHLLNLRIIRKKRELSTPASAASKSATPEPSSEDGGSLNQMNCDSEDPSLAENILQSRLAITNWTMNWGPENLWDKRFRDELGLAKQERAIDDFFEACQDHAREGRNILHDLKFAAELKVDSTFEEIRDLFLQGYEMVAAVASEVKFFEVKMDQYAPAVPSYSLTRVRNYLPAM